MELLPDKLPTLRLSAGAHDMPEAGVSVMECVAYLMDEPRSKTPACACPAIARYAARINDTLPHRGRQALMARVPRIAGSRSTEDVEIRRVECLGDFALQAALPALLEAAPGYEHLAEPLKALPPYSADTAMAYAAVMENIRAACGRGPAMPTRTAPRVPVPLELHEDPTSRAIAAVRDLEYVMPLQGSHLYKLDIFIDVATTLAAGEVFLLDVLLNIGDAQPVADTPHRRRRLAEMAYLTKKDVESLPDA